MKNKRMNLLTSISVISSILATICCAYVILYINQNQVILNSHGEIVIHGEINPQNSGIFSYNSVFHSLSRLTPRNMLTFSLSWSPDSKSIAFVYSNLDRSSFHIGLLDIKSKKIELLFSPEIEDLSLQQNSSIAWSPAGDQLIFDLFSKNGCHHLYMYEFNKKTSYPLGINFCKSSSGKQVDKLDISWSSGDSPLVGVSFLGFYSDVDDIYILDRTFSKAKWVAHGSFPVWRPQTNDFSYLCWLTEASFSPSICMFSFEENSSHQIIEKFGFNKYSWSPDGKTIIFIETSGESDPIFLSLINVDLSTKNHLLNLTSFEWDKGIPFLSRWINGQVIWSKN